MSLDEKEINKEHYIEDIDLTIDSPISKCSDLPSLKLALNSLEMRLSRIERALASSKGRVFKATPLLSLIYIDKLAKRRIDSIYENWISYMNYLARYNLNGVTISQTFWNIDSFIFENFFRNYFTSYNFNISFVPLSSSAPLDSQYRNEGNFLDILRRAIEQTRNPDYTLIRPKEKEYITDAIVNNTVYILYFPAELKNIIHKEQPGIIDDNKVDIQLYHHYPSLSKNIVEDRNIVGIKTGQNNQIEPVEKGVLFMGSGGILYNTIVNANLINNFDQNYHSMGATQLNVSMILYHAMLHLKTRLTNRNSTEHFHDRSFINEFVNFTPSVLYGHFTLPNLTL